MMCCHVQIVIQNQIFKFCENAAPAENPNHVRVAGGKKSKVLIDATNSTMNGHGGKRRGAGRPRGAASRANEEVRQEAAATGELPLAYMLRIMRDAEPRWCIPVGLRLSDPTVSSSAGASNL